MKKRSIFWCLLSCLSCQFFFVASLFAGQETTEIVIRSINISIDPIFEDAEEKGFYDFVNNLKIKTKESVIKKELLFKEGDILKKSVVDDTERYLRSIGFVYNVFIKIVEEKEFADIYIKLQDTWTLYPIIEYSTGGGGVNTSFGVIEKNFFGYAKRLELLYKEKERRKKIEVVYDDRDFLFDSHRLTLGFFHRLDGNNTYFSFSKPFKGISTQQSWFVSGNVSDLINSLWANGEERYIFRQKHKDLNIGYAYSFGEPDDIVWRMSAGYALIKDGFSEATLQDYSDVDVDPSTVEHDPGLLAENREYSGISFLFQRLEPDYNKISYIDSFSRIQDVNFGSNMALSLMQASKFLGSTRDSVLSKFVISDGMYLDNDSFFRAEASLETILDHSGLNNSIISADFRYYRKFFQSGILKNNLLASSLIIRSGYDMDKDKEFLLGASSGLRGYKNNTFYGNHKLLGSIEDRFVLAENVLKLIDLGAALFVDVGGTDKDNFKDIFSNNLYSDIGFGLRIGLPRSSGGNVIRIDFAFPLRKLEGDINNDGMRVLFATDQVFKLAMPNESIWDESSKITIDYLGD